MDKKSRNLILGGLALLVVIFVALSVMRSQRDGRLIRDTRGPGLLSVEEIRSWPALADLSKTDVAGSPSPARRVAELMGADIKEILAKPRPASLPLDRKTDVVRGLNDLLRRRDLYQVADFRSLSLPAEARSLVRRRDLVDREVEWLNRLLFEAAFPKAIVPSDPPAPDTRIAAGRDLLLTGRAVDLVLGRPAHIEERQKQFGAREVLWADAGVREDAIVAIANAGMKYPEVQDRAIEALVGLMKGVDREQQDVVQKVKDEEGAQRSLAWKILARYGEKAIPREVAALKDPSGVVRDGAVEGLGVIGYPAVARILPLVKEKDTRGKAIEALFRVGPPAVEAVIPLINDRDEEVRAAIAELLGRFDDQRAVPALISRIDDTAPNIRRNVVRSLGQIADPAATLVLARVMKQDPQVRMEAITALGEIGDPRGVDPLVDSFKNLDLEVPKAAIAALNKIGTASLPRLLREVRNPDPEIRLHATQGLAALGGPTVVGPLLAAAQDSVPGIREAAVSGMAKFLGQDAIRAVPTLVRGFQDTNAEVSYAASQALTELGSTGSAEVQRAVVAPLVQLLGRSDQPAAQFYANRTLAQISGPVVVSALVAQLNQGTPTMQKWAALTLGDVEQREDSLPSEPVLRRLTSSADPEVRWAAETALRKMGRVSGAASRPTG